MRTGTTQRILVALALTAFLFTRLGAASGGQEPDPQEPEAAAEEPEPEPLTPQEVEVLAGESSRAEAGQIASRDAALSQRLRSILTALPELGGVEVDVNAGVVTFTGTVPTRQGGEQAVALAGKLEGVLLVVDQLQVETASTQRLASAWKAGLERLRAALAYLPLLGIALVIMALAWLLARLARDAELPYRLVSEKVLLQNLLRQTAFVAILLGGLFLALRFLDAGGVIGTVLGAAGVAGIALGFAFRNIVENYLAGVLLALQQPFRARDVVQIDGVTGTVLRMTSSETTLLDSDGNHVRLPNATVFNGKLVNYTRNPLRRFTVPVAVGNDVALERAQELGVATLARMKGVVADPAPSGLVVELGDSTIALELYGWVDQRAASFVRVVSEAHRLVKVAFEGAGLSMPPPSYQVHLDAPHAAAEPKAAGAPPAAVASDAGPAPEAIDVTAPDDVARQVEEELARSDQDNLLEGGEARAPA